MIGISNSKEAAEIITGLLAHPISHSFSPIIHNSAAEFLGINLRYYPFDVAPNKLFDAITGMKALGIKGFNVSIPHKKQATAVVDHLEEEAEITGAVNTIVNNYGVLTGYNTDVIGFSLAAEPYNEIFFGKTAMIIGAGGSASAVVYSLISKFNVQKIYIVNRTLETAHDLVKHYRAVYPEMEFCTIEFNDKTLPDALASSSILVNCTPIGMHPNTQNAPELPYESLNPAAFVFDLVYNPIITLFLKKAEAVGCKTLNGLDMLLYQAAGAFELWTGEKMPVEELRKTLPQLLDLKK
ncbi:MAG: shikimate dehydrogenase [Ignavibacteriales bacterium]|nr:Shikimate dehydrogenase (NADP(+)) [Ignavibacteriaceae bacterium]MBW7871851.1 shikimate dehydrogenase [Ignavibacteria bacterium]MBZ0197304.1 shikimate dehydrogenase [Ignavibacteriaceae bacterium]MCZ2144299.1 shikimate dehydrogenase [Ignavibacteriales bacterium]WKZ73058.1 MAG: shikimate dehydrogenase [Ignavibacteriaceae bacterium]